MKAHLFPLLGAFAAGIAVTLGFQSLSQGPTPDQPAAESAPIELAAAPAIPIGKSPVAADPPSVLGAENDDKSDFAESAPDENKNENRKAQRQEWQKQWKDRMRERTDEKNRIRLEYLAAELGLTPEQVSRMEVALDERLEEGLEAMSGGNFMALANSGNTEDPVEAALAEIMSPEQEAAYTEVKEKERAHKVEARTMQRFAGLPETLNLTEEQRDQIYDVFAQEEASAVDQQSPAGNAVANMITTASGGFLSESVSIDISDAVTSAFVVTSDGNTDSTPQNAFARMREVTEQRNEARVESMRPILDERQLEAYRSHLSQRGGMFSNGFGGMRTEVQVEAPSE
jgi:hypothetical protein